MKRLLTTILLSGLFIGAGGTTMRTTHTDYCADANCAYCWRFNDDTDQIWSDAAHSDTPEPGVNVGATYVTDGSCQEGNCYSFTTDDYIYIRTEAPFNSADVDFSFSIWVKPEDATPTTRNALVTKRFNTGGIDNVPSDGWDCFINASDGLIKFSFLGAGGGTISSSGTLSDGIWGHIAVTYNATSNAVIIYINGSQDGSGSAVHNTSLERIILGNYNAAGGSNDLEGELDEFAMFDRVLTAAEVLDIYKYGLR